MHDSTHRFGQLRRQLIKHGVAVLTATSLPRAMACEAWATTLRVTHPWTRASRTGATTAAVNLMIDEITVDDRLIDACTPVAKRAQLIGEGVGPALNLWLPRGRPVFFEETRLHLQLVELTQALEIGCQYPLELTFETGGVVKTSLSVDQLPLKLAQAAG